MKLDMGGAVASANSEIAAALRDGFARSGTFVINLISAPGSGKTTLLQETGRLLAGRASFAVIVGDPETRADAERLVEAGVIAQQVETMGSCHLDAKMVMRALEGLEVEGLDVLAIENVGNLVCPVSFDLGEDVKVSLVSLPEGPDKPSKYPAAFAKSRAFVVTKADLAPHLDCDEERLVGDAMAINPELVRFRVSSKTGEGMEAWIGWLLDRAREKKRG